MPQVWAEGWESRGTRGFCFQTKPQLARWMLESGVPFAWVAGDEVYGSDRDLRRWLERDVTTNDSYHYLIQ